MGSLHTVAMNAKVIANQKLHPKLSTENRRNFSEHGEKSSMEETLTDPNNETGRKERTSTKRDFEVEICRLKIKDKQTRR
jgi:hypothetical protein